MRNLVSSYIKDEQAITLSVETIMFVVIGIGICLAVGYWIWNTIAKRTEESSCKNNPGPFCME